MKVAIIHPAPPGVQTGNRVTAQRWAQLLQQLGCEVRIDSQWSSGPCDALIALHAGKSEPSIRRFKEAHPRRPLIVAGTGTDIYGGTQPSAEVRSGLELASHIVVLQPNALAALPTDMRTKARVVYQSVRVPEQAGRPEPGRFDVALVANLRPIKDPLRAASAARLLPASSRLHVFHAGSVLDSELGQQVELEAASNSRYTFLGQLDHAATLDRIARSQLLINSSFGEGGANVVSEALALGVPLICSNIPGSTGLLGEDYPGLFEAGDERGLADLLWRAESEPAFLAQLREHSATCAWITAPALELESWRALLMPGDSHESSHGA